MNTMSHQHIKEILHILHIHNRWLNGSIAIPGGISENEQTDRAVSTTSLRCFVTQQDIANMALYLASPFGATISGQALAIDGDIQMLI